MAVISFDPDDAIQGTGLLSEVNARIKDAKFGMFTYPNTSTSVLAALITVVTDDGVEEMVPYSIGDSSGKKFQAADGGKSLTSITGAEGLPKGSNFIFFTSHLREIGVPKEMIQAGDISLFKGLYAFWQRKPTPEREGLVKTPAQLEKEKRYGPPTALVPTSLLALPGEKVKMKVVGGKAGTGTGTGRAAGTGVSTVNAGDGNVNALDAAKEYVLTVLGEQEGGRITRKKLGTLAFSKLARHPQKSEVMALLGEDSFIEELAEVGVAVDDGSLVLVS